VSQCKLADQPRVVTDNDRRLGLRTAHPHRREGTFELAAADDEQPQPSSTSRGAIPSPSRAISASVSL
jgi:hypothetical protein